MNVCMAAALQRAEIQQLRVSPMNLYWKISARLPNTQVDIGSSASPSSKCGACLRSACGISSCTLENCGPC